MIWHLLQRTLSFCIDTTLKETAMNPQRNSIFPALILLTCGLFVAGCGGGSKVAPLHAYLGLDASQSARPHLGGYTLLSGQIAGRLNADTDTLTLVRLDDQVTAFSDKPATGSTETTLKAIAENVQQVSPGHGTFPEKFWEEVATRAEQSHDNTFIVLFTDGDNDDQREASRKAIRAAAERLAKNPRVKAVILCGVERRNYAALQADFAALGEHRFHLLNPQEMEIDTLAGYLQWARSQAESATSAEQTASARR